MDPFRGLSVSFHVEDGAERIEGTDENVIGSCQCPEFVEILLPENSGELCEPGRRSRSRSDGDAPRRARTEFVAANEFGK